MAHSVIKYRLTAEGSIPDFLYLGDDGVNGVFGVNDINTPWPRSLVQIGITKDNATGDFEIVSTKTDLLAYLTSISADWKIPDPSSPGAIDNLIPFDPAATTDWVWSRLDALNGA